MPTSKTHRNGHMETHQRGRLTERSSSFHGAATTTGTMSGVQIRRPNTVPDLVSDRNRAMATTVAEVVRREPPKVLMKVTVMGSLGPVQVLMRPESTVAELVAAAVRQYVKEGRRPLLPSDDPSHFDLHYSQFSLESLEREVKLRELGSRNFFLCPRKSDDASSTMSGNKTTPFGSCSKEADKAHKGGGAFGWLRFIDSLF